jgi:hypothetical protein
MRRILLRASYVLALVLTTFALGAELGWQEMPPNARAELGGYQ